MTIVIAGLVILLWPWPAGWAQPNPVPELINYQGLVYLPNGSTDVTGAYDIEFRLYDAPVLGNLLWGEKLAGVQVYTGRFNVILGNGAAIDGVPHGSLSDAFRKDAVYIEFTVDVGNIIRVRQRFVSAPHAFAAQNAYSAVHGVPPGTIMPFAGGTVPYGWLGCDGASVSKSAYPDLYAALCDSGSCIWGETADAFNLPNLGGRVLAGANATHTAGVRRGAEKHALIPNELPAHAHTYRDRHWNGDVQDVYRIWPNNDWWCADDGTTYTASTTASTGSSTPHNIIQPSAVVKFIIKY